MIKKRFSLLLPLFMAACLHAGSSEKPLQGQCLVLNLERAVSQALNQNRQLMGTVDSLTQAQYGIDLATREFSLSITPTSQAGYSGCDRGKPGFTIGGGIDFSKKLTTGTLFSVAPTIIKGGDHYKTGINTTISQPLLRGLGKEYQLSNLRSAQFSLRTAYRNLYIAQVQLILRTIQNLYEVVKLERSFVLNEESYRRIHQFHKAAKLKEKIGLADALDVYRAEIELHQAEDGLKATRERLEEAQDSLRDLLALPLDLCIKVDVPTHYTSHPVDLERAIKIALERRIEIDQAEDEQREFERLSAMAEKNLLPELNLVLNYSNMGRAKHFSRSFKHGRENTWGIGLTTATAADSMADQIAYQQSLLAINSAARGADQAQAAVILEVKKAARLLDRTSERIVNQELQIRSAQGELRLAQVKFNRGLGDNFNVIQAEKTLRNAQQNYSSAIIDHIVGEFQLLAAMGLLTDKPLLGVP